MKRKSVVAIVATLIAGVFFWSQLKTDQPSLSAQDYAAQGVAAFKASNLEEAKRLFELQLKAADSDSSKGVAYYNIGTVVIRMNDRSYALQCFENATKSAPKYVPAWLNLGMVRTDSGDATGAEAAFTAGLQLAPNDPMLLYRRGLLLFRSGNTSRGLQDLKSAVSIDSRLLRDLDPAIARELQ